MGVATLFLQVRRTRLANALPDIRQEWTIRVTRRTPEIDR
jgi:hypothetical protein